MPVQLQLANEVRDLLLGPSGDLVIVGGEFQFTTGLAAIAQSCQIAIQTFQGEWFADLGFGLPYWQQILGFKSAVAIAAAQVAIRATLLAVPGVINIPVLQVTYNNATRGLSVNWTVSTLLGDTPADTISFTAGGGIAP